MNVLEDKIIESKKDRNHPYRNEIIEKYLPFIIKSISNTTGRYVSHENSDEYMVGLEAFNEAIDRYDKERGSFLNFASLLINSRVKDYLRKDKFHNIHSLTNNQEDFETQKDVSIKENVLREEIVEFKKQIQTFGISFLSLVEESPKHKKTREEITNLGKEISKDENVVAKLFESKKFPMAEITFKYGVTKKRLKTFRNYLIAIIIIHRKNLTGIKGYLNRNTFEK